MKDNPIFKTNSKGQSFLHGSLILFIATALVKLIGAIYRIPLANLLGPTGMGFYSTAYDLYVPMYSIAMAGLPIAISRIVAEHVAAGRYKDVGKTLRVAKLAFVITGGTGFVLMIAAAFLLTGPMKIFNAGSLPGILCIAPCLIFCCVMSAYRGYYEGLRNMTPTAVSEVLEALGKLVFGYLMAFAVLMATNNYSYAAAGALLGISIGTALSSFYLVVKYRVSNKHEFSAEQMMSASPAASSRDTLKRLVLIAIPIVLGSLVNNVTSLIDVAMVQGQLARALAKAPGYFETVYAGLISSEIEQNPAFDVMKDLPNSLYGCHRGYAFSIYNLVPVLTSVLGVSAIPVLATAWTRHDKAEVKSNIQTMLRTTAIIAIPAGLGIAALSHNILSLLYSDENAISIAAPNLRILGICAVLSGLNAPIVSMLQAIGKQSVPLKNIAVGAVLKIIINFVLVGTPSINIVGVPIGTTVCYAYICIANFICLVKHSGVMPNMMSVLIKPLFSGAVCAAAAFFAARMLPKLIFSGNIVTVVSILLAALVYVIMLSLLRVVEREDIYSLPNGKKIAKVLAKFRIIR